MNGLTELRRLFKIRGTSVSNLGRTNGNIGTVDDLTPRYLWFIYKQFIYLLSHLFTTTEGLIEREKQGSRKKTLIYLIQKKKTLPVRLKRGHEEVHL